MLRILDSWFILVLLRNYIVSIFIVTNIMFGITLSYAAHSINVPLNSRIYLSLDKLASKGLIESQLVGIRPFTRNEISRLLIDTRYISHEFKIEEKVVRIIEDMEKELSIGEEELSYFKPIGMPEMKFLYLKGDRSYIPVIKASQHGLIYNNEGIEPEEGSNGYLGFDVEGGIGPLIFHLSPLLSIDGDTNGVLKKGYLRLEIKGLDIEVGKKSIWWGQGYHGGLFLTNNAEPLNMLRLTNPHPVLLPWIFRYIGPFRFDLFVSRLEEDRAVPDPYFTGVRFSFKPHPVLELGLTRTIIMGGEGRPETTPGRLWDIMFGENKEGDEDLSNSIAGIDFRLNLSFASIYGEWGGEDEAGGLPYKGAYLFGLYLPGSDKDIDFRVEYADITNETWYTHGLYSSGYTYKGRIIGHHVGGGGRDLFLEMGIMREARFNGRISLDYEERGVTTHPFTEKHYQVGTEWEYGIGRAIIDWSAKVGIAYERIKNADYTAGVDKDNGLVSIGITGKI